MPRRPAPKPGMGLQKALLEQRRVPREEWPADVAAFWNRNDEVHIGWWKQLKELSASELRVLAHSGLSSVYNLELEVEELRSELEKRDRLRTKRGKAAQLPVVEEFRTWVQGEWEIARNPEKPRPAASFASRMIARKGAPITDPKTILRWCREWEAERRLAANPPMRLPRRAVWPKEDVFSQVHLVREYICHGDDPYDPDDFDNP